MPLSLSLSLSQAMKGFICTIMLLLSILLILVPAATPARNIAHSHPSDYYGDLRGHDTPSPRRVLKRRRRRRRRGGDNNTVHNIAGSRLPDCGHACGSCSPCRLVMVSFKCASLAEAETCPMAYKCFCNTKSFPVP